MASGRSESEEEVDWLTTWLTGDRFRDDAVEEVASDWTEWFRASAITAWYRRFLIGKGDGFTDLKDRTDWTGETAWSDLDQFKSFSSFSVFSSIRDTFSAFSGVISIFEPSVVVWFGSEVFNASTGFDAELEFSTIFEWICSILAAIDFFNFSSSVSLRLTSSVSEGSVVSGVFAGWVSFSSKFKYT